MKFLHVYCESRKAEVYISLDKITLIQKLGDGTSLLEVAGNTAPVKVNMSAEDLARKINGEDKTAIGFRAGR